MERRLRRLKTSFLPRSGEARLASQWDTATLDKALDLWISGVKSASQNLRNMENPTNEGGAKNQLRGLTEDGYEVYETNSDLRGKSYKEKLELFESSFYDENSPLYFGSKIQFERKGKLLYAEIDRHSKNEILHKINPSHLNQWDKAKINVGASGDFVTLMENSLYKSEKPNTDRTKNDAHKRTATWEYYAKSIYVDGKPFDVIVNIRREDTGGRYVYDVKLRQNKNLPQLDPQAKLSRRSKVQSTRLSGRFDNNVPQSMDKVKRQSRDLDSFTNEFFDQIYDSADPADVLNYFIAQQQQRIAEMDEKEKQKWEQREAELRQKFKEQRAKNVEQRNTTKVRNSAYKKVRRLDKMLNRSSKDKTVKEGMR